ncbi:MAG: acyltransferase, partial [Betaproteobacteria bacterium]|nr:acyltransferase [Betaproteobacteria bacterium]
MVSLAHLSHPKYRTDIDGLRAVAILSVVGFHAFPDWIQGGFIGVDIFFVISGFLISTIIFENLEESHFSYAEFYARRIKRIFPALILILVASFFLGWFMFPSEYFKLSGKHLFSGAAFLSNFALLREAGYFDASGEIDPFHHLWSLAVEEQFYIFWPLLLGLVWKRRWNFLLITLAVAASSFTFDIVTLDSDAAVAFYSPLSRFWELMVGGVLAYLNLHKPQILSQKPQWMSSAGGLLLVLGFLFTNPRSDFPGWLTLFPTLGTFLLMGAGPKAWLNRQVLSRKGLVWFGLISYPLYLWHWPLLVFARVHTLGDPSLQERVLVVGASIFLAWATYQFVEKPVRWRVSGRPVVVTLLLLLAVLVGVGKLTDRAEGFPERAANLKVLHFHYDVALGYRSGSCFLDASVGQFAGSDFSEECSGRTPEMSQAPLVLLWGDSYAAALYPGLKHQSDILDFALAQYTANGCPPIENLYIDKRKNCMMVNEFIFSKIQTLKPHTVILAANWLRYDRKNSNWTQLDLNKLQATIAELKKVGVAHIVLVGQLPTYKIDQPMVGNRIFVTDAVDRTIKSLNPQAFVI